MKRTNIESIEFKDLCFSNDLETKVFSQLNFKWPQGIVYLRGNESSGKKIILQLLMGLLSPSDGAYLINGVKVNDMDHFEFDSFRLNFGQTFDVGGLINNMTIYENFRMPLDYHDVQTENNRHDYILAMMKIFHLDNLKHLRPSAVSLSTRKAACLLRAFILRPQVLVLDDPTQGLAHEYVESLAELIKDHQKNWGLKYIVICSEDGNLKKHLIGRSLQVTPMAIIEEEENRRAG